MSVSRNVLQLLKTPSRWSAEHLGFGLWDHRVSPTVKALLHLRSGEWVWWEGWGGNSDPRVVMPRFFEFSGGYDLAIFWHFWLVQIAPRSLQMITNNPKSPKFSSPAAGYPFSFPIQYDWVQKGANDSRVAIHMTHLPYPYGGYIADTRWNDIIPFAPLIHKSYAYRKMNIWAHFARFHQLYGFPVPVIAGMVVSVRSHQYMYSKRCVFTGKPWSMRWLRLGPSMSLTIRNILAQWLYKSEYPSARRAQKKKKRPI